MWKLTEVADAPPVIVWVAVSTCLMSIMVESSGPTFTVVAKLTPASPRVKVSELLVVLVITMLVTTAVVLEGTVYKVVEVVVVAAPRNRVLDIVAISYYLPVVLVILSRKLLIQHP
jgi:hypothetical protein